MKPMEPLLGTIESAFTLRCREALEEFERLRALGVSLEIATVQSGLRAVIMGRHEQPSVLRDGKALSSGDEEDA